MSRLQNLIRQKYHKPEDISAWWTKYAAIRRRRLWKLSEQQNHRCCYCSRRTWMFDQTEPEKPFEIDRLPGMSKGQMATADHIIPRSHGGSEGLSNLIMACLRCNNLRGDMPAMAFWEAIQDPVKIRSLIAERSRLVQRNQAAKDEKRAPKRLSFIVHLSYLLVHSPIARLIADEAIIEIDAWSGRRYVNWG